MKPNEIGKAIVTRQTDLVPMEDLIKKAARDLGKSLPKHLRPERIVQIYTTLIRQNPELAKCTPISIIGALFVSAQLGLEPVAGQAYILPFNNNRLVNGQWVKIKEAQFLIGYRGLANLFFRHEKSTQLNWGIVKEKDEFAYEYGTNMYLRHIPAKEGGQTIGYYVIAGLQGGGKSFMYMTKEDCLAHGQKHSKTFDKKTNQFMPSSPWRKDQDPMCLKTVLIQLGKLLPLSIELQRAIATDETSREYREGIDNALDLPSTTDWTDAEAVQEEPVDITPKQDKLPTENKPQITNSNGHRVTAIEIKIHELKKEMNILTGKDDTYYEMLGSLGFEKSTEMPPNTQAAFATSLANKIKELRQDIK